MPADPPRNHSPTIRLLGGQVSTALKACGELRADFRALDGTVDGLRTDLAVLQQKPPVCEGCQALQIEIARLKERMSIAVGLLGVLQIISTAVAAYLAAGR